MRLIFIFLSIFVFLSCQNRIDLPEQGTPIYHISDNISNQQITTFTEDAEGYIWIGTNHGLNKFNGYDYRQYMRSNDNPHSLSGNTINSILSDSKNRFWVATENGVSLLEQNGTFRTIPIQNKNYPPTDIIESPNGDIIINLCSHLCRYNSLTDRFEFFYSYEHYNSKNKFHIDQHNRLWIVSIYSIECFDYPTMHPIKKIDINKSINLFYSYLSGERLYTVHGKGDLRIINIDTLEEISVPDCITKHSVLSQALITIIHPYEEDKMLINTHKNGLYIYNWITDEVYHQSDREFPFEVPDQTITCFLSDSQGNLWIGTYTQNFKVIYGYSQQFNNNHILQSIAQEQSVTALASDKDGKVWIATYSDLLYIFDTKNNQVNNVIDLKEFFTEDPFFQDKVSAIHIDEDDNIWIKTDTKVNKCIYLNKKLVRTACFNLGTGLYDLAEDRMGNIWTGTYNPFVYIIDSKKSSVDKLDLFKTDYQHHKSCLITLSSGDILVASSQQYLTVINPVTKRIKSYCLKNVIEKEFFTPGTLYEDSEKNIWIAVLNQGLYKFSLDTGEAVKMDEIPLKNIISIIEDSEKNLWLGTLYGLSKYDVKQQHLFSFYAYDGIGGNQFNKNSVGSLPDGNLIFGGTHGLTVFDPSAINIERQIPLYIEELNIQGVFPVILSNQVKLKHNENNLSISFAALDYSKYPRIRYYYKMDRLDNTWIDARNNRQVSYSNLSPGEYVFRVYITSYDNTTILAEKSFKIMISPAPWLSTGALILYAILLIGLLIYINNLYLRIKNNKNQAQIALREKEYEKHINEMNLSFFTNISHEFRTPLTMIAGPVSTILKDESLNVKNRRLLTIVNRSITRMLKLVNQILYFNKLDNDAISLNTNYVDVVHEINEIIEIFAINDNIKGINIQTFGLTDSFFMLLDKDKLEKILNNILSNAFKHSPANSNITVRFDVISENDATLLFPDYTHSGKTYIKITVEDKGTGIPEDKLENIFLKYYQIDQSSSTGGIYNYGTGIGLYYTKRLVNLHHGYIKAANRVEGGAVFTVLIPLEETQQESVVSEPVHSKKAEIVNLYPQKQVAGSSKYTILVIDDDTEVAAYLHMLLYEEYTIINKYTADSAYASLEDVVPDIILCDVIMPGISGYEFSRKLKQNKVYSHIPVILLTAKSSVDEQIEGLDMGANAYIPKPFDPDYLMAVIRSQLVNLENLRKLLTNSTAAPKTNNSLSENDNVFITKLYELMEDELSNSELNINEITKKTGMSRTKFYLKIKGLTGENPNALFRKYKLNRAAELIKTGKYNVSEVAAQTGFSTLSHFSVSFKKQFGISPKEYK